ncbi:MAG: OPT/YSL family transporter [Planctomycetes bacterium]|nr:OPT/YSL family transporter [Planctomycetota bacterium]
MKRDLTPILFGVVISTILAGTLTIAGLKAGITPGVSPLVILCAWGIFAKVASSGSGSRFLNLAQVAGSAGMAVTSGVIFTAPLVQILHRQKGLEMPPVDFVTLMIVSLGGALIGWGFVGLATKKFLTDPSLPAPEARACEAMIDAAVAGKSERPRLSISLGLGLLWGFVAPLLVNLGLAHDHVVLAHQQREDREFSFDLPFNPIYLGIGGLLTVSTALLVAGGSFLRLGGDWLLTGVSGESLAQWPANSMRWVGGGAMTIAVLWSLFRFLGSRTPKQGEEKFDESLLEVDSGSRTMLRLGIVLGVAILVGWVLNEQGGITLFGVTMSVGVLAMSMIMVTLGAILSLQIGSSASPVSGTVFVTTLVLCLLAILVGHQSLADVLLLTPLLVGACVAVCTANDSSQDYKTMQFCGVRVRDGFLAQILGLIGGCVVVPLVLYIAHEASIARAGPGGGGGLGSDDLAAPQGKMFATLVDGLLLEANVPIYPILIGLAVGVIAVAMEIAGDKKDIPLPSMALAVGIYLPPALGVGILIGSLFRFFGQGRNPSRNEGILAAAGLITGAAAFELLLGIAIVIFTFDPEKLTIWPDTSNMVRTILALVGIVLIGLLLFVNYRPARK